MVTSHGRTLQKKGKEVLKTKELWTLTNDIAPYAYDPWEFHKIVLRGIGGAYPFKVLTNVIICTLLEIHTERYSMTQTKKFENGQQYSPQILSDSSITDTSR